MSKPYTLRGIVVDDADKPVAGAEVRISMLLIRESLERAGKMSISVSALNRSICW